MRGRRDYSGREGGSTQREAAAAGAPAAGWPARSNRGLAQPGDRREIDRIVGAVPRQEIVRRLDAVL